MRNENFLNKPLPCSDEAERAILGGVLLDNSLIVDCIGRITHHDFYSPLHRRVYEAMVALYNASAKIDPILIVEELKKSGPIESLGGVATITNFTYGLPHFTDLTDWINIVAEKSKRRKLIQICGLSSGEALEEDGTVDDILERHEQLVYDLRIQRSEQSFERLHSITTATVAQLQDFGKNPKEGLLGITTGFRDLDIRTSGWEKQDFIILAARPSMGKTALACRMAYRAGITKEKPLIVVFSLEMSKRQITTRIIAVEAGVDLQRLRRGQLSHEEWNRVHYTESQFAEIDLYIDDTPGLSVLDIKTRLRRLTAERRREPSLVIIDHLGLIAHADGKRQRHLQLSDITKGLKAMAKEFDVPVIALSQLSRLVESRKPPKPIMSDLRESGAIEEDADVVAFIYRPQYYMPEIQNTDAEIIFGKVRNGPTGSDYLAFIKEYTRFENISHGVLG